MKVRRYGHIHQLSFYAPVLPINVQLIEHELGLVLIDTALKRNASDILAYIEELDKPLLAILLTHAHGDHVGGVDAIKAEHPLAELFISRRDARLLSGDRSLDEDEQNKIRGSLPTIHSTPDTLLDPGERLFGLQVLAASGHTPGSIAFYDEANRVLLAGDAFQSQGGAAVAGDVRPLFPLPGLATWNRSIAVESAERLIDLSPLLTFVGHGPPLKGTHRLYLALKRAQRKQARKFIR
ncbi:MBL fold metallo-hydrolase [Exiguobacterium aestuarii]|uniref:MBL fold metallo-hydrolase n=1 Tax=Exiguobacterium aestuarii TaxID=273527 RepID=A0ABW2PK71_9BACL|nr:MULTISPECIES: MBL fold metallo-hydrolase [Exiguobacterium]MCT4787379.1 MBL fold metallo-hydrolase [Exiguobacterium aestuarii]